MNTRSIWSLLLLAATLTTGSCSKENEEAPSLKFELSTGNEAESDAGTESPVFVVPGKTVEMTYAAENATSIIIAKTKRTIFQNETYNFPTFRASKTKAFNHHSNGN